MNKWLFYSSKLNTPQHGISSNPITKKADIKYFIQRQDSFVLVATLVHTLLSFNFYIYILSINSQSLRSNFNEQPEVDKQFE